MNGKLDNVTGHVLQHCQPNKEDGQALDVFPDNRFGKLNICH